MIFNAVQKKNTTAWDASFLAGRVGSAPIKCTLPVRRDKEQVVVGQRVDIADLALDPVLAWQVRL